MSDIEEKKKQLETKLSLFLIQFYERPKRTIEITYSTSVNGNKKFTLPTTRTLKYNVVLYNEKNRIQSVERTLKSFNLFRKALLYEFNGCFIPYLPEEYKNIKSKFY